MSLNLVPADNSSPVVTLSEGTKSNHLDVPCVLTAG